MKKYTKINLYVFIRGDGNGKKLRYLIWGVYKNMGTICFETNSFFKFITLET
jgi:hypothetical protein